MQAMYTIAGAIIGASAVLCQSNPNFGAGFVVAGVVVLLAAAMEYNS